ncbi:hypothetical protein BJ138DRAFT_1166067, partial [Hygrophoropsis aurantiaca]
MSCLPGRWYVTLQWAPTSTLTSPVPRDGHLPFTVSMSRCVWIGARYQTTGHGAGLARKAGTPSCIHRMAFRRRERTS